MVGQRDEAGIARRFGNSRGKPSQHHACVERLEMPEMRAVIQHQDGHDLAVSQPRLWSALLGRLRALPQQQCLPVRAKRLAKIIELTEVLHEPVEHGRLPTSDGADSRRGIRNCPGGSAKSGLWPRQRPESQFFQRKFAYRPPLRGGTWAPSRGTWAVTKNLLALIERLTFVRSFGLDPQRRERIHPDRWAQLVREGAVTPSWLADDFNAGRRHALIAAQLIELISKLTDATITMFCRMIALLFTKSKARQDRRHLDARKETGRLLRMFGDTLRVLAETNETGEDTFKVLDREIGWDRLV